ncbi:MAG TPA: threonine/serine dehydratase [Candidatus Limnocylindria bacterium]|nr:threonine/serine dehydratase [Candidatus Limnocylindria bacterium]
MTVGLADAQRAQSAIAGHVLRTPLVPSHSLGERIGAEAFLKLENLQRTGSFKVRGAVYAMSRLSPAQRAAGVVTMSAGNAAQAIAYAGRAQGVHVTVVMPETAPKTKIDATRGYGGEIRFAPTMTQLLPMVQALQARGLHFLHPFDDDDVIAGHASLGLEIIEDVPEVDLVVVPVGGGGLISGVAVGVKGLRPGARIVGVEPEGAQAVRKALDAGHSVRLDSVQTVADGLAAPFAGERNLEIIARDVADVVVISDEAILEGLRFLVARARIVPEPAGAAAVGALLCGAVTPKAGERVVAIVSGGNIDPDRLAGFLA